MPIDVLMQSDHMPWENSASPAVISSSDEGERHSGPTISLKGDHRGIDLGTFRPIVEKYIHSRFEARLFQIAYSGN